MQVIWLPGKACNHSVCLQQVLMGSVTGLDMQVLQWAAAKLSIPPDWEEVLLVFGERGFSPGYRFFFLFWSQKWLIMLIMFKSKRLTFILE